ncbi:hypothetical protein TI05_01485 [Achromatium sp. WMS3]|nr:hypothetical protein TI05_01485 [Achromatium sp. WMS3]
MHILRLCPDTSTSCGNVIKDEFTKTPRNAPTNQINLIRYADDFVITGKTKEILERAKEVIGGFLQEIGLSFPKKNPI